MQSYVFFFKLFFENLVPMQKKRCFVKLYYINLYKTKKNFPLN